NNNNNINNNNNNNNNNNEVEEQFEISNMRKDYTVLSEQHTHTNESPDEQNDLKKNRHNSCNSNNTDSDSVNNNTTENNNTNCDSGNSNINDLNKLKLKKMLEITGKLIRKKYRGISYDPTRKGWSTFVYKNGVRHKKFFSALKYGNLLAKKKSIEWRLKNLEPNSHAYVFSLQAKNEFNAILNDDHVYSTDSEDNDYCNNGSWGDRLTNKSNRDILYVNAFLNMFNEQNKKIELPYNGETGSTTIDGSIDHSGHTNTHNSQNKSFKNDTDDKNNTDKKNNRNSRSNRNNRNNRNKKNEQINSEKNLESSEEKFYTYIADNITQDDNNRVGFALESCKYGNNKIGSSNSCTTNKSSDNDNEINSKISNTNTSYNNNTS
ncbi:AP2 domain transcription factor, putative, partial [Hepatocystis sp. ex Piliocolobus tephrosceles]